MVLRLQARKCQSSTTPFQEVVIDGERLDANQVADSYGSIWRCHTLMQVIELTCPNCGQAHFDCGEWAYTPHIEHVCGGCSASFRAARPTKEDYREPVRGRSTSA